MSDRNAAVEPREDAGRATAENGVVILEGPDGVAVTMTPDAAARTADSLQAAAKVARHNLTMLRAGDVAADQPGTDSL